MLLRKKLGAYYGIVTVHPIEAIIMERGLLLKSSNLDFFGLHYSRVLMNMFRGVIVAKE